MFLYWLACAVPSQSLVAEVTTSSADSPTDTSVTIEDSAIEYADPVTFDVGLLNADTWSSSAQRLFIKVWYPANNADGSPYVYGWTGFQSVGAAQENLTAVCTEPRPLIVHSHGNASVNWELYLLHEHLAANGYIVVAPDHPGNTFYANTTLTAALTVQRPQDIRDTVDWIFEQSRNPSHPLFGCVDPDAGYTVSGYSFGGYTAYMLAGALANDVFGSPSIDMSDARVTAAMVYAPWSVFILDDGTQALTVPVLSLVSANDLTVGNDGDVLFSSVTSAPRAHGRFETGGHFTFAPQYCPYLPSGNGCGSGNIDPSRAMGVIQAATVWYLNHLRQIDTAPVSQTDEFQWQFWTE